MDLLPRENEIVLFRYRNRLTAGVCVNASRTKARFAVSARESLNVPLENILQTTGNVAPEKTAGKVWLETAYEKSRQIDLAELWELVREEDGIWRLDDLAELYYNQDPDAGQLSAMLVALDEGDHFDADGRGFVAVDQTELAHRLEIAARADERAAEREAFLQWFSGDDQEAKEDWLDRIKDVALHGEQSAQAQWLERMAGAPVSARRAFDRLVRQGAWDQHTFVDLIREDLPLTFSEDVMVAAREVTLDGLMEGRRDLTYLDAVTIDDASTTDMDDAVSVCFDEDGGFQIGVHITDVSALIAIDSVLDREAQNRGSSLYLPEVKHPMLPPCLSENVGSLVPDEDRLAVSVLWEVDRDGQMGAPDWCCSVIRCREKLSYDAVDQILDDNTHPRYPMLMALFEVAEGLFLRRVESGAAVVGHVDRRVDFLPDGSVAVEVKTRNSRADLLVSELMVAFNVEAGRLCVAQEAPVIFRVQNAPDLSDLVPTEIEQLHRYQVLTRMRPASVSLEPGLHGGLCVEPYCQATSPLRRFMDLVSQRQLVGVICNASLPYALDDLTALCPVVDERSRLITRLERRRERYWVLQGLSQYRGQTFEALVMDVWERRARVEVLAWALQVDVRLSQTLSAGDFVEVRLTRVDPLDDDVTFVLT